MNGPFPTALLVVVLAMLVPIVPFALFGGQFEALIGSSLLQRDASLLAALIAIALPAIDILLPVPSTAVMTWSGAMFGWLQCCCAGQACQ